MGLFLERIQAEAKLESAHKELVEASRRAGMAEVATSVLHNVGNVLNSVNVSVCVIAENVKKTKGDTVAKVAALMQEHAADLGNFMTADPRGRQLPDFLGQLAQQLGREKGTLLAETDSLSKQIDHIKDIVAMQQSYATISGVTEKIKVDDLAEDALRMNASALIRHDVRLFREYDESLPWITVEKHKAVQILVNLIRNAKQACDETGSPEKRLTIRLTNGGNRVRIALEDNGVGIEPENLNRIFNLGFTTKKDGHGFGLHSSCLAASEMGGSLTAHSDGPGKGATFVLELPCQPEPSKP
jgi:C4-dicarboxylate-specific signal transduction histidine kinase